MKFSIWPSPFQTASEVIATARHADSTGWDGVYVSDHFMGDGGGSGETTAPTLESTALLAALATATSRVRLGSLVFGTTYRHPAVVANWAATVDHLSGGRFVLGIGAGWQENEHEQYGIELPPVRERIDRFAEVCAVTHSLLRQPATSFSGDWFELSAAVCEPKPVQEPLPILIGGKGDRMMRITARWADAWNMWSLPEPFAERAAFLDSECERIGRDPAEVERSTQALVMVTDDAERARELVDAVAPRSAVAGTVEQIAETVAGWQEVGVDELIVPDFVLGSGNQKLDNYEALLDAFSAFRG